VNGSHIAKLIAKVDGERTEWVSCCRRVGRVNTGKEEAKREKHVSAGGVSPRRKSLGCKLGSLLTLILK